MGDWVQVRDLGGDEGFVEAIEPRQNRFARPAAANIDQLVIIGSQAIPTTDPYLIDRVTAIAVLKDCRVLVCLNKCDLDPAQELYRSYTASAIPMLRVSAETGEGLTACAMQSGKADRPHRQLRRGKVQHPQRAGAAVPPAGGGGQRGTGPWTPHHPPCGDVPARRGTYVVDTPGFSSFDTDELNLELKDAPPGDFPGVCALSGPMPVRGVQSYQGKRLCRAAGGEGREDPRKPPRSYVRLYDELKPLQDWQHK